MEGSENGGGRALFAAEEMGKGLRQCDVTEGLPGG